MKLLFCSQCEDLVRLNTVLKKCKCSTSVGKLLEDDTVQYSGPFAFIMNIPNENVRSLLNFFSDKTAIRVSRKIITEQDVMFVINVINYLNQVAGTKFKPFVPSAAASLILARKAEADYTMEDFKSVIDKCQHKWKGTKYAIYMRPDILFSREKFSNYLGELTFDGNQPTEKRPAATPFNKFRNAVEQAKGKVPVGGR